MCILPIYSNSHGSIQTVERNIGNNAVKQLSQSFTRITSKICVTSYTFFTISEATSLMCILEYCPYIQTAIAQSKRDDWEERTMTFGSHHRPSQKSHLKFTLHLTIFQLRGQYPHKPSFSLTPLLVFNHRCFELKWIVIYFLQCNKRINWFFHN